MTAKLLRSKWHYATHGDDLAKLILGEGKIVCIEKRLSKSKLKLKRLLLT